MQFHRRRALGLLAALLLAAGLGAAPAAPAQNAPAAGGRVVLFGIDGADAAQFERLRAAGRMPNFDALAKEGVYARLATTNPAQSPVSWAAAVTGSNPGKTGIYDFVTRLPESPGRLGLSPGKAVLVDGPLGPTARKLLPSALGAAAGLVALGLVLLLLRLVSAIPPRVRTVIGVLAGLVAAVGAGVYAHRFVGWVPTRIPKAVSNRMGTSLWTVLGEAGVDTVALEAPISFPADRARNLRLLAGLGVPDVQGKWAAFEVFTDNPKEIVVAETGGMADFLAFGPDGTARSRVYGPTNFTLSVEENRKVEDQAAFAKQLHEGAAGVPSAKRFEERVYRHAERSGQASCVLEVRRDAAARTAMVRVGSGGPRPILDLPLPGVKTGPAAALPDSADRSVRWGAPVTVKEREWSDYVPFEFDLNPLVKVKGIGRFWLESAGGDKREFRLFLGPISFDPSALPPNFEVSWPADFAPSLASAAGLFSLVGWPCLTNPVKDDMLSDEAFLADARIVLGERRRKLAALLAKDDWRFLFAMFSEVDRVQHAFWRHIDPKSPTHDPAAAKVYGGAIDEFYVAMDSVLGDIRKSLRAGDTVLVMSDHGFASFRRSVNINNWLLEHGFQRNAGGSGGTGPARNVDDLFAGTKFYDRVDWAETKAYAVGLGGIYLNLKGREKEGSVDPARADAVCAAIRKGLLALRDEDGAKVVHEVYLGKDLYKGPTVAKWAPDLVIGFERGYRVSWQTTLGGGGAKVIEDNDKRWSGDHCSVDPSLVPGILLSSKPLRADGASVMDVAPTVLQILGVPAPKEWDGRSLLPR